jgi:AmmeMemoRadiSam system protein B
VILATRPAAVAGVFYASDPRRLAGEVDRLLARAAAPPTGAAPPKALIAPHAGHVYSGPVAATAYRSIATRRDEIDRVVLVGPAHRVRVDGLAVPAARAFETPLGAVEVDGEAVRRVLALPQVVVSDLAHAGEHALEVHLPFLQRVLGDVRIVPLLVGAASAASVAEVLDALWGGPETLVVVSSDLSHYHDHPTAQRRDQRTASAIVHGRADDVGFEDACGAAPIRGLLLAAGRRELAVRQLDLRTSADTAGTAERVVGYGAFGVG